MKTFEFTGLNKKGTTIVMTVDAESDKAGRAMVKSKMKKITMSRIVASPAPAVEASAV